MNTSNDTISLNGVSLGVGVEFDFTTSQITSLDPGERVLVVENIVAFEARYGTGFPIAGQYAGKLANGGEQITLTDSSGQLIHDFAYDDLTPWPVAADGDGPSLEVVDLNGDYNDPANWRASLVAGGTPDAAPAANAPQVSSLVRDGGSINRPDLLETISVTFDADVDVAVGDLTVRNDSTGGSLVDTSGVVFSYDASSQTATWNFSSLAAFEPAFYSAVLSDNITAVSGGLALDGDGDDTAGGGYEQSVYVALPGDANLDGSVDVLNDAFILVANLGQPTGAVWTLGDFDGDGSVSVLGDAFVLVANLGRSVVPPVAAASTSFVLAATNTELESPDSGLSRDIAFAADDFWFNDEDEEESSSSLTAELPADRLALDDSTPELS